MWSQQSGNSWENLFCTKFRDAFKNGVILKRLKELVEAKQVEEDDKVLPHNLTSVICEVNKW